MSSSSSSSSSSSIPTPQQVAILTQKLYDADSDIRYMSLNDLLTLANSPTGASFLSSDFPQCSKMVDGFLNTLNDPNGEVQNLTIKCLGPFVLRAHPEILGSLLLRVANQKFDNTVDSSISSMALRTIIISLPRPTPGASSPKAARDSYESISKVLIPRLIGAFVVSRPSSRDPTPNGLLQDDLKNGTDSQAIDILTEIAKCFGIMLHPAEVKGLQQISLELLESPRSGSVMKKKSMAAFAALAPYFSDPLLSAVVTHIIESMKKPHVTPNARKNYINLIGSLARAIPTKFGAHLKVVAPFVLSPLSQQELDEQVAEFDADERDTQADEVREMALATLESFLSSCPADMHRFTNDTLDAILRFLKYDPNLAGEDEDMTDGFDDEDDDFADDEDFEQEDMANDEDDISWKVRRSAAKTLQAIIAAKGKDLLESSESFSRISKTLLDRFKEREESVRLEVVQTTTFVVRQCSQDDVEAETVASSMKAEAATLNQQNASRKRRRGLSDAVLSDQANKRRLTGSDSPSSGSPTPPGAPANLANVGTSIMQAGLSLAATSTTATKLASVTLLKTYIVARHGGANDFLKEIFDLASEHIQSSLGTAIQVHAGSGPGSLQVESLQLLCEVCKATTSAALQGHIAKVVPAVIKATHNKSSQVACEALKTAEQLVKAMTPPRSASRSKQSPKLVGELLDVMTDISSARSSDLDTRKQAIAAIGITLGRTLGPDGSNLITDQQRHKSFALLQEGMKNETTRYASIRAIEAMGAQSPVGIAFDRSWFTNVSIELGNQLRKADRALRGASLAALRVLIADRKCSKSLSDTAQMSNLLLPLLSSDDLHLIGPCLVIFASLISDSEETVVTGEFIQAFCSLLSSPIAMNVVDQMSSVADAAGLRGAGKELMSAMLKDVGVNGSPAVVGKVIGGLLASAGEQSAGIKLDAFLNELNTTKDDKRKCLALSVIGQVGLRSGTAAPLRPELFTAYFDNKPHDVPIAAAVALGRAAAGAGNLKSYIPVILAQSSGSADNQYFALHSIRELLQYNDSQQDIAPYSKTLWDAAVRSANSDESRTIGAECLSLLAFISPKPSLQTLQAMLNDSTANARNIAIVAFRDIFSSADSRFNNHLRPLVVDVLSSMMRDATPDNRKTALNTLSTAARHKPELVLPSLSALISPILDQTLEDASLVREVSMGPFKHKVDDGLEARKSAYETLYSLLELSPAHITPLVPTIYPRIVAGLGDDAGIRGLCQHMIVRLAGLTPEETARVLDDVADKFKAILTRQLKENTVRIDQERLEEAKRSVIKACLDIQRRLAETGEGEPGGQVKLGEGGVGIRWLAFVDEIRKEWHVWIRDLEKEMRERL